MAKAARDIPVSVRAAVIVTLILLFLFIRPYLNVVMLSALIAFLFYPVYRFIVRKTHSSALGVTGTLVTAALTMIIPILLVLTVTVGQVNHLIDQVESGELQLGTANIDSAVDRGVDRMNGLLSLLPGGTEPEVSQESFTNTIRDIANKLLSGLVSLIKNLSNAFIGFISTSILSIFLIIAMLKHQSELIAFIKKLSPFDDSINDLYLAKAAAMTTAMIKGQLIIAVVQGILSAASLWLMGINYFWFFMTILIFLSFIPLGAGIVTIPIGVIMMFTGNIWQGIFIIVWHVLVVSNADNVLRPRLVPKAAKLNSAMLLLAVFSGLVIFGALGVIFGPVVMILLISSLEIYSHYNDGRPRPRLLTKI